MLDIIDRQFEIADQRFENVIEQYKRNQGFGDDESFFSFANPLNVPGRLAASALIGDFESQRDSIFTAFTSASEANNQQGRLTALADMNALYSMSSTALLNVNVDGNFSEFSNDDNSPNNDNPDNNYSVGESLGESADAVKQGIGALGSGALKTVIAIGVIAVIALGVYVYVKKG